MTGCPPWMIPLRARVNELEDVGGTGDHSLEDRVEGDIPGPAVIRLWENAWAEFAPFLDYSPEIRRAIYSTNAIESLHARVRRATHAREHFPNDQAALNACTWQCAVSTRPAVVGGG